MHTYVCIVFDPAEYGWPKGGGDRQGNPNSQSDDVPRVPMACDGDTVLLTEESRLPGAWFGIYCCVQFKIYACDASWIKWSGWVVLMVGWPKDVP